MKKALKLFIYANILFLIGLIVISLFTNNIVAAISNLVGIPLIYSLAFLEKRKKIEIPLLLHYGYVLFLMSSICLGTTLNFYKIFTWWDIYLHTFSGILIAFFGFYLISILNKQNKTSQSLKLIFAFSFPLGLGVIWEIYEYTVDNLFGLELQHHSLDDTMSDLIVATIGAILGVIIYIILFKKNKQNLIEN